MKRLLLLTMVSAVFCTGARAQGMLVRPGTHFRTTGPRYTMVLRNASFSTAVPVQVDSLLFKGSGDNASVVAANPLTVHSIQVGMNAGKTMTLQQNVRVHDQVAFTSGFLDLNNTTLTLDSAALLTGETETTHTIAPNGGQYEITQTLETPLAANPGNLGIIITAAYDLGLTTVRRGHKIQTPALTNSMSRYYDIVPQFNTNLAAIIRFLYLDAELNGQSTAQVNFFRSANTGTSYTNAGIATINSSRKFANLAGVQSMARFTLSDMVAPLPVRMVSWEALCQDHKAVLQWEAAATPDIEDYTVEKSEDAQSWSSLTTIKTASTGRYSVTDKTPASWYRLVSRSSNGQDYYSNTLQVNCSMVSNVFELVQNPVKDVAMIRATVINPTAIIIKISDPQGRHIQDVTQLLNSGTSMLSIPIPSLAAGMYQVVITDAFAKQVFHSKIMVL